MQDVIGDEDWQKRKKIPVCPSCTLHKQKRNKKGTKTLSIAHAPQYMATPWQYLGQAGT